MPCFGIVAKDVVWIVWLLILKKWTFEIQRQIPIWIVKGMWEFLNTKLEMQFDTINWYITKVLQTTLDHVVIASFNENLECEDMNLLGHLKRHPIFQFGHLTLVYLVVHDIFIFNFDSLLQNNVGRGAKLEHIEVFHKKSDHAQESLQGLWILVRNGTQPSSYGRIETWGGEYLCLGSKT